MACYHPIPAHQDQPGGPVRLWPPVGTATVNLPCGNCLGCRTDHATDWARRAEREASQHKANCFITLTYDEEHLPHNGHLEPEELKKFFKRLRRKADHQREHRTTATLDLGSTRIRYMAAGEYGEKNGRPHYHALLFGCDFKDAYQVAKDLKESTTLAKLWKNGAHKIGALTGASANYVAQYTLKKIGYTATEADPDGVVKPPPFMRASLKPAIGTAWTTKYAEDLKHGYLVNEGKKGRIPRAIKKQLAKINPQLAEQATAKAGQHKRSQHNLESAETIHKRKNELKQTRKL